MVVGRNPVKLRRGLVVVRCPVVAAIVGNLPAPVVGNGHALIIVGVDPEVMVVAVGRVFQFKCFAAIFRHPIAHVHHIYQIFVLRVGINPAVIPGPLQHGAILIDSGPGFTRIVGPIYAGSFGVFDDGPHPVRVFW